MPVGVFVNYINLLVKEYFIYRWWQPG